LDMGWPLFAKVLLVAVISAAFARPFYGQDLAPRAYLITPVHSNAVTIAYSFLDGNIVLSNAVPITGATARFNLPVFSYFHSMRFFGRSSSFTYALPYGVGNFRGQVVGAETEAYRSGLLDSAFRFSVNLKGGPAMNVREFANWQQRTLIGVSLKVTAPMSQYDPTKLINLGSNRWAFRPEVGLSQRRGHWILDTYGGAWFFTTNPKFFSQNQYNPGVTAQSKSPVGAFELHLSYDVRPRLWASVDGNFWFGGGTSLNGVPSPQTSERNSRIGGTVSIPISRRQSVKFSYSNGTYIRYGGNYQNVSFGWQYSWIGRPD
jgi:hypothetical protein